MAVLSDARPNKSNVTPQVRIWIEGGTSAMVDRNCAMHLQRLTNARSALVPLAKRRAELDHGEIAELS